MGESELDKLYFPHFWSKRLPHDIGAILEQYVEFDKKYNEQVKNLLKCEFSIPYGIKPRETINIFGTNLPNDAPIFIHIHGGYWQVEEIKPENQSFIALQLHKHNVKCMAIGYELCPNTAIPKIAKDVEKAIKKCLDYAKTHKSKAIYLCGHSAGAHLVASLFTKFIKNLGKEDQNLFKAVFLLCGLYDLTPLLKISVNDILKLDENTAKESSPVFKNISAGKTVFQVITAEFDSPAFIEQSKQFYQKLIKENVQADYHLLKDYDHFNAMDNIVEEGSEITRIILDTIRKTL